MIRSNIMNCNANDISKWLKNNFNGYLADVRWKSLADVITHTSQGTIQGWGYAIEWSVANYKVTINFEFQG